MNFIELTTDRGRVCVNMNHIRSVSETGRKYVAIELGGSEIVYVLETYVQVLVKLNARIAGVNRL